MKKLLQKLKCFAGFHEWIYHSSGVCSPSVVYYGEKCQHCGESKITWFGKAYRHKHFWNR